MKYLKLMDGQMLAAASRNKREISAVLELGWEVTVISGDETPPDCGFNDKCRFLYYRKKPVKSSTPKPIRVLQILHERLKLARYLKTLDAAIISCHNIVSLESAYLSCLFTPKKKRPKLVYDSHEFEMVRVEGRSRLYLKVLKLTEGYLMRRCAFSIMVNDSIADEVQKLHGLSERPVVVRSMPEYWHIDKEVCKTVRRELLNRLNAPESAKLAMYHGFITIGRGLENILRAIALTQNWVFVILGDAKEVETEKRLRAIVSQLGLQSRVLFRPAVPHTELWKYIGAADVGLTLYMPKPLNYYYGLPNKFFENIQAETPQICSDFPELSRLVKQYDVGLLADPQNPQMIAETLERFEDQPALSEEFLDKIKLAKKELCWEREKAKIKQAYRNTEL